jgi:sugar lactone lactonase YvrE
MRHSFAAFAFSASVVACSSVDPAEPGGAGGAGPTGTTSADGAGGAAETGAGSGGDSGGAGGGAPVSAPELGSDATRVLTVVAGAADGLDGPRDLAFAPEHPDQLWTVNEGSNGVVLLHAPGTAEQVVEARVDYQAGHFMDHPSGLAFGAMNRFATSGESRDSYNCGPQAEDDFMGPTLWSADLDVFAVVGQGPCEAGKPEGSHIDMLHSSPLAMGIAHEADSVFWVFDGLNGEIVRYDFQAPHEPGGSPHGDGRVRRFGEAAVTRAPGVASHLGLDVETGWLYVADTGAGRLLRLDTKSGAVSGPASSPPNWDGLDEYVEMAGVTVEVWLEGLAEPSGVEVEGGRVFVTEHGTGTIRAFDRGGAEIARAETGRAGLMGIALGPDGKLWGVDAAANEVFRVDP